jgi:YhcH/YjgK/YiaL family protein
MILDTHDRLSSYATLFRGTDPAPLFDWLRQCAAVEPGTKVDFDGDKLFARALRQDTGARDQFRWETHRDYIDLQYIVGGGEIIEWTPAADLRTDAPYDAATDFQFYAAAPARVELSMSAGLFVFLFPEDGHKPLVSNGRDAFVHKVIAKIHRSLLVL